VIFSAFQSWTSYNTLESVERPSQDTAAGPAGDPLYAERGGGGEWYDAGDNSGDSSGDDAGGDSGGD
jgi:hypothetical protein